MSPIYLYNVCQHKYEIILYATSELQLMEKKLLEK